MSFFGILINILFKFIFTCNPLLSYYNMKWRLLYWILAARIGEKVKF